MVHPFFLQVDLFFYREPEEAKQQEEEEEAQPIADYGIEYNPAPLASDQWPVQGAADAQWIADAPQPISAVTAAWTPETGRTKLFSLCKFYLVDMVHLNIFVCTGAILLLFLYISNVTNMFDVSLWAKRVIYKLISGFVQVFVYLCW